MLSALQACPQLWVPPEVLRATSSARGGTALERAGESSVSPPLLPGDGVDEELADARRGRSPALWPQPVRLDRMSRKLAWAWMGRLLSWTRDRDRALCLDLPALPRCTPVHTLPRSAARECPSFRMRQSEPHRPYRDAKRTNNGESVRDAHVHEMSRRKRIREAPTRIPTQLRRPRREREGDTQSQELRLARSAHGRPSCASRQRENLFIL